MVRKTEVEDKPEIVDINWKPRRGKPGQVGTSTAAVGPASTINLLQGYMKIENRHV